MRDSFDTIISVTARLGTATCKYLNRSLKFINPFCEENKKRKNNSIQNASLVETGMSRCSTASYGDRKRNRRDIGMHEIKRQTGAQELDHEGQR